MDAATLPPLPPDLNAAESASNGVEISATSRLILAQGIHQLGNGDWDAISSLINLHPLHAEQTGTFTPTVSLRLSPSLQRRRLTLSSLAMQRIVLRTEQRLPD